MSASVSQIAIILLNCLLKAQVKENIKALRHRP